MIEQAWQAFGFLVALAFVLANVALGKPRPPPLPPCRSAQRSGLSRAQPRRRGACTTSAAETKPRARCAAWVIAYRNILNKLILLRRIVHSLFNWDLDLNDDRAPAPAPAAASRGPAEGVTPQREHAD